MAQPYPAKPVRLVSGGAPGTAPDILARLLAQGLGDLWKQSVIVENRAGAMGRIGASAVATATPDGYSLYVSGAAQPISAVLYRGRGPEPLEGLAGVSLVAEMPLVLVVQPSLKARDLKELVSIIKSQASPPHYASAGSGSLQHLVTEHFKVITGTRMVHVPYKGGAEGVNAVLSGETMLFFAGLPPALPHINSGRLRALAVTTEGRFPALPDVPTLQQAGLNGLEAGNWFGLMAPKGTPRDIIGSINGAVIAVLRQPESVKRLLAVGAVPSTSTPEAFDKLMRDAEKTWAPLIKELDLKVD
jgi:tripartite-type tricarboxylate transporter receptor subunit TctC